MKRKLSIIIIVCMIFTLLPINLSFADTEYSSIEIVDSVGDVGQHTSIDMGSDGPCISYYDATNGDLKYAYKDSSDVWHIETVDSVGDVGMYTSLVMDGKYPNISYYDKTNGKLKYAYKHWRINNGKVWVIEDVDNKGDVGMYSSLGINMYGTPRISYYDQTNKDLKYAYKTYKFASSWNVETVDSADSVGEYTSLAVDMIGAPRISYYDQTNGDLKYALKTAGGWLTDDIGNNYYDVGGYTSLALDKDENFLIIHYAFKWRGISYVYKNYQEDSQRTGPVERSDADQGQYSSVDIDGKGTTCISYYDSTNSNLKCAYMKSDSWDWKIETVDSLGDVGMYTSLAIDENGNPHISYYDQTNGNLKYAKLYPDISVDENIKITSKEGEIKKAIVTITNNGFANLVINQMTSSSEDFIIAKNVSGTSIHPKESNTFEIIFSKPNIKDCSGEIEIQSNDPDGPVTIQLSGEVTYSESNVDLKSLAIDGGSLNELFDSDRTVYKVQNANNLNSIEITAETINPNATITINDNPCRTGSAIETIDLRQGANLIPITVTSEDNTNQKSYVLSVNGKVSNSYLDSLTVSKGMLDFDKEDFIYDVNVGNDTKTLDITATPNDNKALVLIDGNVRTGGAIQTVDLEVGENPIEVMVVAQDASTKTYTVNINRGAGNVNLSGLNLSHGTLSPSFEASVTSYSAIVPYTVDEITITPTAINSEATVTVNGEDTKELVDLEVGPNTITIVVTGKDGISTKTYEVTIERKAKLTINNESLPIGMVDVTYSAILTAEGGTGSYTWKAEGLPEGLKLDGNKITGKCKDEGDYKVKVTVTDGNNEATKELNLKINLGCGNGGYIIKPVEDSDYIEGFTTRGGIRTMTITEGVTGFKYFTVNIIPVSGHTGDEVAVFAHYRNDIQIDISFVGANFDEVHSAGAGFNLQEGDIIKVYIIDEISKASDKIPSIL